MHGRIVQYRKHGATKEFWTELFQEFDIDKKIEFVKKSELYAIIKNNIHKSDKILEGGCGIGKFTIPLLDEGYNVIGVDYSKQLILKVKRHSPKFAKRFIVMDARRLNFPSNHFNVYLSPGVVEHFQTNDQPRILDEARRVLKKDGRLLLVVPFINLIGELKLPFIRLKEEAARRKGARFYQYRYTKQAISQLLLKNGFEPIKYYFVGLHDTRIFGMRIIPRFLRTNRLLLCLFATTICVISNKI